MATSVLMYDQATIRNAAREAVSQSPSPSNSPAKFATGLSVFDVPEGVMIHLTPPNRCEFQFEYPNREPGESEWRELRDRPGVRVCLGVHSGKILRVSVENAQEFLQTSPLILDPVSVGLWVQSSSSHIQKTALMSAAVVSKLFESMHESVRSRMLETLSQVAAD